MKKFSIIYICQIILAATTFLCSSAQGSTPVVQAHQTVWYANWLTCSICQGWVTTAQDLIQQEQYQKMAQGAGWLICVFNEKQDVCKAEIEQSVLNFTSQAFTLMLSQDMVCGYYFHLCGQTAGDIYYLQEKSAAWRNALMTTGTLPAGVSTNDGLDSQYNTLAAGTTFNIMWLSDVLLDQSYTVGASKTCTDRACCHADKMSAGGADSAGQYGSRSCYFNMDGFKKMIDTINAQNTTANFEVTSIVYGGSTQANIPEHLTGATLTTSQTDMMAYIRSKNPIVGLYYALGETDLWPPHLQDMADTSIQALNDITLAYNPTGDPLAETTIPAARDASNSWDQHGYYSMPGYFVSNTNKDNRGLATAQGVSSSLVAIFLNGQACDNRNFGLMKVEQDPAQMLQWLIVELATAELQAQKVWIFGNRSPGSRRCNNKWAIRYNAIIERFQNTVVLQQFGYDEEETFQLQFSADLPDQPFGVILSGGRASSLGQNPKFKVIEIDSQTLLPVKSSTYEYGLDKVEADPAATDLLTAINSYPTSYSSEMTDLSPSSFKALAEKIRDNEQAAISYLNNITPNRDLVSYSSCDDKCRKDLYCRLANASQQGVMECRGQGFLDPLYGLDYAISQAQNPWVSKQTATG